MTQNDKISFLKQRFLNTAYVKDAAKGYVVVEPFNLAIDPDVLEFASRSWAQEYHDFKQIDTIVGLPDAGARLVSILAGMLRIERILPSKRSDVVPGAWENVVSYTNASYTTDKADIKSHIGFIKPGESILIVDDVIAYGETAVAAIKALQAHQVNVIGMCVLFDKVWQGGVARIEQETGIKPYSLIRIQEITTQAKIILA